MGFIEKYVKECRKPSSRLGTIVGRSKIETREEKNRIAAIVKKTE
jgi:hypothetical protein